MTAPVVPTQQDREAAAEIYSLLGFGPCQHIIDGIEDDIGVVQVAARHRLAALEETARAAEERDALLSALGWKTGPFRDAGVRKVIIEDSAALRPEMVKARRRAQDAEGDRDLFRWLLGDAVHGSRSGLLARVWESWKLERSKRRAAEAAIRSLKEPNNG